MVSSIIYLFAGLGCSVFALGLTAFAAFLLALWLGLLPGVAERLKRLGKEEP